MDGYGSGLAKPGPPKNMADLNLTCALSTLENPKLARSLYARPKLALTGPVIIIW